MTKRTGDGVDKTLRNMSHKRETSKSAFVLLLLIYAIAAFLTTMSSRIKGQIVIFDIPFEYSSLTGVFFATMTEITSSPLLVISYDVHKRFRPSELQEHSGLFQRPDGHRRDNHHIRRQP